MDKKKLAESQRTLNATAIVLRVFGYTRNETHISTTNFFPHSQRLGNVIFLVYQRRIQIACKHINFHIRLPLCALTLQKLLFSQVNDIRTRATKNLRYIFLHFFQLSFTKRIYSLVARIII